MIGRDIVFNLERSHYFRVWNSVTFVDAEKKIVKMSKNQFISNYH